MNSPPPPAPDSGDLDAPSRVDEELLEAEAGWLDLVSAALEADERRIRSSARGFEALNPSSALALDWDEAGLIVSDPAGRKAGLALGAVAMGRGDVLSELPAGALGLGSCNQRRELDSRGSCLRRLEHERAGVIEWWENSDEGLMHGFEILARPQANSRSEAELPSPLAVEVEIIGAHVALHEGGRGATLSTNDGWDLTYTGLRAWDAEGRELEAWMEASASGLALVVDDERARYPVTIDPLLSTYWQATGAQDNEWLGYSVARAGDVNGDGFGDVIVGAPFYDSGGATNRGRALLYLGAASGLQTSPTIQILGSAADTLGRSVASAGDVNGDGFDDVVVGAPFHDTFGSTDEGQAQVFFGAATSPLSTSVELGMWHATPAQAGWTVEGVGDLNGDGYSDVAVGVPYFTPWWTQYTETGMVTVYFGAADFHTGTQLADWTFFPEESDVAVHRVARAGNLNSDGYDDLAIGCDACSGGEGKVFVFYGSSTFGSPSMTSTANTVLTDHDNTGNKEWHFGRSVDGAGDVNGDGVADLIVGEDMWAPYSAQQTLEGYGRVLVYFGTAYQPIDGTWDWDQYTTTPDYDHVPDMSLYAPGDHDMARLGFTVAGAGDVNGDGVADIMAGEFGLDCTYDGVQKTDCGRAILWLGEKGGNVGHRKYGFVKPAWHAQMGFNVDSAGDVNGDGYADLLMGIRKLDAGGANNTGGARVYYGQPGGLDNDQADPEPEWTADGPSNYARLSVVASVGDLDGDGFEDMMVGMPEWDGTAGTDCGLVQAWFGSATGFASAPSWSIEGGNAYDQFGASITGLTDFDGSGEAAFVIAAPGYDAGGTDDGRFTLYYAGVGSDASNYPATATTESFASSAYVGTGMVVASGGDINGDGLTELLVAYPGHDGNRGDVDIWHGDPGGLGSSPDFTLTGSTSGEEFGTAIARAGDVNGDGLSDIVVGVPGYNSGTGRAMLYYGDDVATGGLSHVAVLAAPQDGERFGTAVSAAGDHDGDGYSDLAIAGDSYDTGESPYLMVLYGRTATPAGNPKNWLGDTNAYADHRISLTSGDFNGDGLADIAFGFGQSYSQGAGVTGRVNLYLGSATPGSSSNPDWTELGDDYSYFGMEGLAAGDHDGDGIDDLLVTEPRVGTAPAIQTGRVHWYPGNRQDGSPRTFGPGVRLLDLGGTWDLVGPGGRAEESDYRFRMEPLGTFGRLAYGIDYELQELGTPFDVSDATRAASHNGSPFWNTHVDLSAPTCDSFYRWRVRPNYDPASNPPQRYGPWVYGGYAGDREGAHFITAECP